MGDAVSHFRAMQLEQVSAQRVPDAVEGAIAIGRLYLTTGRRRAARAAVDGFLATQRVDSLSAADRPYLPLARFYADAGQPLRARQLMVAYEREMPQEFRQKDHWPFLRAWAAIRLAEGNARSALGDLDRASRESPVGYLSFDDPLVRLDERPELARVYDRAGYADSAIATYERYLATRSIRRTTLDAFELPAAVLRLAQLYEARGDRAAAARHYLRFADLWKDADPDLQPRVREARRRAAELTPTKSP
jgi:eukaryotic-like serine/threonine-protein kinase